MDFNENEMSYNNQSELNVIANRSTHFTPHNNRPQGTTDDQIKNPERPIRASTCKMWQGNVSTHGKSKVPQATQAETDEARKMYDSIFDGIF